MNTITPHLWFDTRAEEAARFHASAFEGSEVGPILRYDEAPRHVRSGGEQNFVPAGLFWGR